MFENSFKRGTQRCSTLPATSSGLKPNHHTQLRFPTLVSPCVLGSVGGKSPHWRGGIGEIARYGHGFAQSVFGWRRTGHGFAQSVFGSTREPAVALVPRYAGKPVNEHGALPALNLKLLVGSSLTTNEAFA